MKLLPFLLRTATVDLILASLDRALKRLDKLADKREQLAETKRVRAERILNASQADRNEAHRARRVAGRISDLLD